MGKTNKPSQENPSRFANFPFTILPTSEECRGKCCGNGFISEPHFVYHLPYPGEESSELVLGKDETTLYRVTVTVSGAGSHETVNIPDTIDVESGEIIVGRVKKSWHVTHEGPDPPKMGLEAPKVPCKCVYCSPVKGQVTRKRKIVMRVDKNEGNEGNKGKKGKKGKKRSTPVSQAPRKKARRDGPQENPRIWNPRNNNNNQAQEQPRQQNWPNYQAGYQFQFNYSNYQQNWNYGPWRSDYNYNYNYNYNYQANYSHYGHQWTPMNYWDKQCRCMDCSYANYHWEGPRQY